MTVDTSGLEAELRKLGDPQKREWWTNYVKGADFYGVPMADLRHVAIRWWHNEHRIDQLTQALALFAHPITEVKLAGVAIMERVLQPTGALTASDLPQFRAALDAGALDDWNTCDWFCVKVLNRLKATGEPTDHAALLAWSDSTTVWTKRSALVGFVGLLAEAEPSDGFDHRFLMTVGEIASDERRFCQTAIGWTMRELSIRNPSDAEDFIERHLSELSRESVTNAVKRLEPESRSRLLAQHQSA